MIKEQARDWGTFKKPERNIKENKTERKIGFLHPLHHWKMQFPKPRKYYIINKYTTFTPFYYPYIISEVLHHFYSNLNNYFFFWKNRILVKSIKSHALKNPATCLRDAQLVTPNLEARSNNTKSYLLLMMNSKQKNYVHIQIHDERILQSDQTRGTTGHTQTKVVASDTNFPWWLSSCNRSMTSTNSFQRYDQTILRSD